MLAYARELGHGGGNEGHIAYQCALSEDYFSYIKLNLDFTVNKVGALLSSGRPAMLESVAIRNLRG